MSSHLNTSMNPIAIPPKKSRMLSEAKNDIIKKNPDTDNSITIAPTAVKNLSMYFICLDYNHYYLTLRIYYIN